MVPKMGFEYFKTGLVGGSETSWVGFWGSERPRDR